MVQVQGDGQAVVLGNRVGDLAETSGPPSSGKPAEPFMRITGRIEAAATRSTVWIASAFQHSKEGTA